MNIIKTLAMFLALTLAGCLQTGTNRGGGDGDPGDPPTPTPTQYADCTLSPTDYSISFSVTVPGTSSSVLYNYELRLTNGSTVNTYTGQYNVQGLYNSVSIPAAPTPQGWDLEIKITPTGLEGDFPPTALVSLCPSYPNADKVYTVGTWVFTRMVVGYWPDWKQCTPTNGGYLTVPRCNNNIVKIIVNQTGEPTQNLYVAYKLHTVVTCADKTFEIFHNGFAGSRNGTLTWGPSTVVSVLGAGYDPATVKMQVKLKVDFISTGASATGTITCMGVGPTPFSVAPNQSKSIVLLYDQLSPCVFTAN